jgi:uncharacterized repeat protein (TIGR03806 family)
MTLSCLLNYLRRRYKPFLCLGVGFVCLEAEASDSWQRVSNTTLQMPASYSEQTPDLLPPTLADTGAFTDLVSLTPQPGIVPYQVNVPFWADGAHKSRWFSLPDVKRTIGFDREFPWSFPEGTIWIKHFALELKTGQPASTRRIETRFLVRTADGAYGVTYRWDESQTNAILVPGEGKDEDIDIEEEGETHTQVWHYPSRSECLHCHSARAGWALGFNTPQLNRDVSYGGETTNQIAALSTTGYFTDKVRGIHSLRTFATATNTAWSLEYRVRSYLAANCAQCHQPGTECLAIWDARISTPTAAANLINGVLVYPPVRDPKARVIVPGSLEHSMMFSRIANLDGSHMPPLATTLLNREAISLVSAWITNDLPTYQAFADWQLAFFNSTDLLTAAPGADPDGDRAVNQLEYLVRSNPLQAGDAWSVDIQRTELSIQIRFVRPANRACEVQWTTNLQDPFSWIALDHPDNRPYFSSTSDPTVIEDLSPGSSVRFYRIRVSQP